MFKKRVSSLILFLLLSGPAMARSEKLSCTSSTASHLIDTSYVFSERPDGYRLQVRYAPGAAPIESDPTSTVRSRDLETLQQRSELFSRLPDAFVLDFKKSQCLFKTNGPHLSWHCFGNEPGKVGDLSYQGLSFFVFSQKVESIYGTSQWYNVGLEFKLSLDDLWGREKLDRMIRESSPEQRRELEFRRQHESVLRSAVVIFENGKDHSACPIVSGASQDGSGLVSL